MGFDRQLAKVRVFADLGDKYARLACVANSKPSKARLRRKSKKYIRKAIAEKRQIRVGHFLQKMDRLLIPRIASSTIQLFADSPFERHVAGTGILFQIDPDYFLVSASHALEYMTAQQGMDMYVFSADGSHDVQLTGTLKRYSDPSVDVGVLRLDQAVLPHLAGYTFLGIGDIDLQRSLTKDINYVAGYPKVLTQIHGGIGRIWSNMLTNACRPLLGLTDGAFPGYESKKHLLFDLGVNEYNLVGISGCAAWRSFREGSDAAAWTPQDAKVVGVVTDQYNGGKVSRATRWVFVCKLLWASFPAVRPALQAMQPGNNLDVE